MLSKNTSLTIVSKFLILAINFVLVVFSTRIWGSEGRGEIALVIANISIITIFSNIFCGSTVAFHASSKSRELLLSLAMTGAVLVSLAGALVFSVLSRQGYFLPLFLISLLISLNTAIATFWLGKNKINKYNLLNLFGPLLILISLFILYYFFNEIKIITYFRAYYLGYGILLVTGIIMIAAEEPFRKPFPGFLSTKSIISYGVRNEFNYLLQFLNYRLSYYFIASMLGLKQLGIFSIAVAITEALWIISRSMSAVHFSNVINSDDQLKNRNEAISFAKNSLIISTLILFLASVVPENIYQIIFGDEFSGTKKLIIYMSPGIIAIAVSNLYGHYFAGTGKLNILRNKSLIGLLTSLILLPVLVKRYQLTGACISLNASYILSSLYLWNRFRKEKQ